MRQLAGTLSVVGTGIRAISQMTQESVALVERADKVLFIANDPLTASWLCELNPRAKSLHDLYSAGKDRIKTYHEMIDRVMRPVREGFNVCFVSYGHPGVFGFPMHEAVRLARSEGFDAEMFPAISCQDALFAELGVDPGAVGCQTFEATDFLVRRRVFDPTSALILLQVGTIAIKGYMNQRVAWNMAGFGVLLDFLIGHYSDDHEVIAYEASQYAWCTSRVIRRTLRTMHDVTLSAIATLYVPPKEPRPPDRELVDRLAATIPT